MCKDRHDFSYKKFEIEKRLTIFVNDMIEKINN